MFIRLEGPLHTEKPCSGRLQTKGQRVHMVRNRTFRIQRGVIPKSTRRIAALAGLSDRIASIPLLIRLDSDGCD